MIQGPDSSGRRWTLAEKILAVLTALLGLGTAGLAFATAQSKQAKEQAQSSAAAKGNDLSTLQTQYDQLKRQVDQLKAQNAKLQSQPGTSGPTAQPVPAGSATVWHSGRLVLADGAGANLDAPQSDPQWSGGPSITYYLNALNWQIGATILAMGSVKADYNSCHNTTGYSASSISDSALQPGNYVCVNTPGGRYSALRILQVSATKLTLDVVTYNSPRS